MKLFITQLCQPTTIPSFFGPNILLRATRIAETYCQFFLYMSVVPPWTSSHMGAQHKCTLTKEEHHKLFQKRFNDVIMRFELLRIWGLSDV
jgi:hypothetical protein